MVRAGHMVGMLLLIVACAGCGDDDTAENRAKETPSPSTPAAHPSIVATIDTGAGPITLAAAGDSIFVELHREDTVARIDPASNEQVEELDVPVHCGLATAGDSGWATIYSTGRVTRFDVATGRVLQRIRIPDVCGLTVVGSSAWVTSPRAGKVYRLVAGQERIAEQYPVGEAIFGVLPVGEDLWFTSEADGGTLLRMDRSSHKVTKAGDFPRIDNLVLAFDHLWAGARDGGQIWKLDPTTGKVVAETAQNPSGMVAHDGRLWFTTLDGVLYSLDPETLEVLSEVDVGHRELGPPIVAFGSIWVAALSDNVVLRIDPRLASR